MDIRKNLKDLIQNVKASNTAGAKRIIHNILDVKAREKLSAKKLEVARTLFKGKE